MFELVPAAAMTVEFPTWATDDVSGNVVPDGATCWMFQPEAPMGCQ